MFKKSDDWVTKPGSLRYNEKENEQISLNLLHLSSPWNNLSPNSSFCVTYITKQHLKYMQTNNGGSSPFKVSFGVLGSL